jgi:hypothetical protein
MAWRWLALCCCACTWAANVQAAALRYCDRPAELGAEQKDRLLRFSAVIKSALDDSGRHVALIARSGLNLERFGVRYSHAGLSLKTGLETPWTVRQLYFSCDEQRPRVFDQGISGFLLGLDDASGGYISVVLLPGDEAAELEQAVRDKRQALQLLSTRYSANAYPFSQRYQNCNQWVVEMLASAWGAANTADEKATGDDTARARAQRWLRQQGYQPTVFDVRFPPLPWLGSLVPWLHHDDHPAEAIARQQLSVSMPAAIEQFVHATLPGAIRLEFCFANKRAVVHQGWQPIAEGCRPGEGDTVVALD